MIKKYVKPKNIEMHYTKEKMVKKLLPILNIKKGDSVLDAFVVFKKEFNDFIEYELETF